MLRWSRVEGAESMAAVFAGSSAKNKNNSTPSREKTMAARLFALLTLLASAPAMSATFTFIQGGFAEGATVTGSFTGTDNDNDGQLAFFNGGTEELTAFSLSFSGNSLVGGFTLGLDDLYGFVYSLDGLLGDDDFGLVEGIGVQNGFFDYAVGPGPAALCTGSQPCSRITDFLSGNFTESSNAVVVNAVPAPAALPLLLGALGMVGIAGRRRQT